MKTSTNSLKLGAVAAAVGGVVAIMMMAATFDISKEGFFGDMCLYLLTIVLFFAFAGAFKSNGQWEKGAFTIMAFVLFAVIIASTVIGSFSLLYGAILLVFGVFSLVCALLSSKSDVWFSESKF